MVRILCNLPLDAFDDRANLTGVELITFGPPHRGEVCGERFPFDVTFDPSTGTWEQLVAALPRGFTPDLVLIWWPDQEPLPAGLERCPCPVVGILSDYNLTLPLTTSLQPFFDVLLCDRAGAPLFERLGYRDVRWFCQYTFKRRFHRLVPGIARDLDLGFVGNLNPAVQRERAAWIARLGQLGARGIGVEVRQGIHGDGYGRFLNRVRIGFNRSIRGEANLRAFEVPACGALLLMERDNLEVRDFFVPDEECVLYGDDDFEDVVAGLLGDPARLQRIARAGHARVQEHSLGRRMPLLFARLAAPGPGRAPQRDGLAELGRAEAMLTTWADGRAVAAAAMAAVRLRPECPRALNALALATLRWRGNDGGQPALQLLQRACALSPAHVPSAINLAELLGHSDLVHVQAAAVDAVAQRLAATRDLGDLCGPVLPLGFHARTVDWSLALQTAVRCGDLQPAHACVEAARARLRQGSVQLVGRS